MSYFVQWSCRVNGVLRPVEPSKAVAGKDRRRDVEDLGMANVAHVLEAVKKSSDAGTRK